MKKKNHKKAMTIVETLMTLLAITIMIAGPLTFMYKSYTYSAIVTTKVVSMGLAQEGLELATSLRNIDLNSFISSADGCTNSCMIDWDGLSSMPIITSCADESCRLYKSESNEDLYRSTGDTPTDYYRSVKFTGNGTTGYLAEVTAWTYVDGLKVDVKLDKMFFNIQVK